jgi:hypothetical protein
MDYEMLVQKSSRNCAKSNLSSTHNEQDFKVELEPPRFENGKELFIAGLRERPKTSASIPGQWQRAMAYQIPNQAGAGAPDFFERYGEDFDPQTGTEVLRPGYR